jgi:hypothetical protein
MVLLLLQVALIIYLQTHTVTHTVASAVAANLEDTNILLLLLILTTVG